MTIRPTAYLITPDQGGDSRVQLSDDAAPINVLSDNIVSLYTRSQIAPLCAPVVDQHGKVVGSEHRRPSDFLTVTGYRDPDGVIWTPPTAFAYAAVCEARHAWENDAAQARKLLAALVDARPLADTPGFLSAQDAARNFLRTERPSVRRDDTTEKAA